MCVCMRERKGGDYTREEIYFLSEIYTRLDRNRNICGIEKVTDAENSKGKFEI